MLAPSLLLAACWLGAGSVSAALQTFNLTLTAGWAAPDGFFRQTFLINEQFPGPLIAVDEGDDIEVTIMNNLPVENSIHWHGLVQNGTCYSDGVPGVTQYPILPGGNLTLRFSTQGQYGFFWYHSHTRGYYADGVRGPIYIRPAANRTRPYASFVDNSTTLNDLIAADTNGEIMFVHDWYHVTSDTLLAMYYTTGVYPSCFDSIVINGRGAVECLPADTLAAATGGAASDAMATTTVEVTGIMTSAAGPATETQMASATGEAMQMGSGPMGGIVGGGMGTTEQMALSPRGCSQPMTFKAGYNISFLNPEVCANTSTPLEVIYTNGAAWMAFHLVNAGVTAQLSFSLDNHSMWVYAADGAYVELQEVQVLPVAVGQRYSVFVHLNQTPGTYYFRASALATGDMVQIIQGQALVVYGNESSVMRMPPNDADGTYMYLNGSAMGTATNLNESALSPVPANPPPANSTVTFNFLINQTEPTVWQINAQPFVDPIVPILFGNSSDGWTANTTYFVPDNAVVDLVLSIANDSLDTMGHPLHLHGHSFWVLGKGSGGFDASRLNMVNPPVRDTEGIPASGWLAIRYVADNPGAWIFHCHIDWHLAAGMAVVLVEGEGQFPTIPANVLAVSSYI